MKYKHKLFFKKRLTYQTWYLVLVRVCVLAQVLVPGTVCTHFIFQQCEQNVVTAVESIKSINSRTIYTYKYYLYIYKKTKTIQKIQNLPEVEKFLRTSVKDTKTQAVAQDWTGDLLITSQMRYHCATPAVTSQSIIFE